MGFVIRPVPARSGWSPFLASRTKKGQSRLFRRQFLCLVLVVLGMLIGFGGPINFPRASCGAVGGRDCNESPGEHVPRVKQHSAPSLTAGKGADSITTANRFDSHLMQGHLPLNGTMVVTCSSRAYRPGKGSAAMYVATQVFHLRYLHPSALQTVGEQQLWNVWISCGTSLHDRSVPDIKSAVPFGAIALYIPGKTPFAAKAGLWQGLVDRFGAERAARIAPMTFIRPIENLAMLEQYVADHPDVSFILKTGKHRQKGTHLLSPKSDRDSFFRTIMEINPAVVQVSVDTVRTKDRNQRTAFRTYVWVRCVEPGKAIASIEWKSPGYIALSEQDYVASGYTKGNVPKPNAIELLQMLFEGESLTQVIRAVEAKVSAFLHTFQGDMCISTVDPEVYSRLLVMEMFGFDWIPVLRDGKPDALLLETNRFADMSLHDSSHPDDKDWLKLCTVMRRFAAESVDPRFQKCYDGPYESRVEALEDWERLVR